MDPATVAVEDLYQAHHRHVLAYCHRRLPPAEADEATAGTFLLAAQSDRAPGRGGELIRLYRLAHRLIEGRGRWNLRIDTAGMHLIRRQADAEAIAEVQKLRHVDRDVLLLHSWEHLPPSDIARVLDISEAEVHRRMARSPQGLADDLQAANPVSDLNRIPNPASVEHDILGDIRRRLVEPASFRSDEDPRRLGLLAAAVVAMVVALFVGSAATGWLQRPEPVRVTAAIETVELFFDRFENGDVGGTFDLISPDALYVRGGGARALAYNGPFFEKGDSVIEHTFRSYRFYAQHASLNAVCDGFGQVVSCDLTPSGALSVRDSTGSPTLFRVTTEQFTVEDGLITRWVRTSDPVLDERLRGSYEDWLEDSQPELHSQLFFFGSMVIVDFDDARLHRQLIEEWVNAG